MSTILKVLPDDKYNQTLVSNVYPSDWKNPEPAPRYNLVVIGAGTAGLVTAAGAAGLGAKVALIEKHLLGGDCLNYGCVPSKCIIRSSRVAMDIRDADQYGIRAPKEIDVDFAAVMERLRRLRAQISHHDSAKRFQELGVDVFLGDGHFTGPDTIEVGGKTLHFKKAVIASGARAVNPPIEGLVQAGYLTNETVFSLTERPNRLAVIGGGPIGCELAQAFRRLGSQVVLLHNSSHILNREDADAAEIVQQAFIREGIRLVLDSKIKRVEMKNGSKIIHFESKGKTDSVAVDEILAGAGRAPNVEGLNLERIGVKYDKKEGVIVNDYLQTTNPRIYAAGDICMKWKFTHAADAAARIVIQNALFFGKKKLSSLIMPWCTYTDPEIAHVGLYERDAKERGIEMNTFVRHMNEVDRSIAEGDEEGFVKVHVKKGTDKILGATIVSRHAGEMISEFTVAMVGNVGLGKISGAIHPYPTQAEAIKQVADMYRRTLLTPTVKNLFNKWLAWTR
jgi:pyruvate/2-oxoglutarate dehydrogenase complex dihydrolipoamide dehydrogenase (E3) component